MGLPTDEERLRSVPVFARLDDARLAGLIRRSALRRVPAGTVVALRGQAASQLIIVEAGALTAVHETARGQRLRLGEFSGPCTVDKAAVLDGRGYSATWVAAKPARLRLLPGDVLLGLIEELPEVRRHVLRYLAAQLRDLHAELARVSFDDTTARVAAWLVCATRNTGPRVLLPGAQEGLAETVGASRVSVNRALRNLAREGWVRVEPGVVVVLAPESLAIRAECGGPAR